jgi:FkbM family methyltransferase
MQTRNSPASRASSGKPHDNVLATEDDIYYAYRLLLGREPDAEGWEALRKAIVAQQLSPNELARGFMTSPEFVRRNAEVMRSDEVCEVGLDGFSLFVRPGDRDIGDSIRESRVYEPHVTLAMKELLRRGDVFVDVGANIGFFTNLAAYIVGSRGFVLAVEPMDKNVQLILRSLERNGFAHVRVFACAASNREGRVAMRTDPGTSNGQPMADATAGPYTLYAQTLCLDDVASGLPKIDLVKLDIEGFELLAWRGFRKGLIRHRPRVLTEFHPYCMRKFVGVEPEEYLAELFAYGDSVEIVRTEEPRVHCALPDDVMREWHAVNERAGAAGKYHLDLLVHPRF